MIYSLIYYLLYFIEKTELYTFADDNAISAGELLNVLKKESEQTVYCFRQNLMIFNPYKFQSMFLEKQNKKDEETHQLQTFEEKVDTTIR